MIHTTRFLWGLSIVSPRQGVVAGTQQRNNNNYAKKEQRRGNVILEKLLLLHIRDNKMILKNDVNGVM